MKGKFVISLDFELFWGVKASKSTEYHLNIYGVQNALKQIIDLLDKYDIKATIAIVGFLFANNKNELISFSPLIKPKYINPKLDNYNFKDVGDSFDDDKLHFAGPLIDILLKSKHEIASHTYSHLYITEKDGNINDIKNDIESMNLISKKYDLKFESIIFPRNLYNKNALDIHSAYGFKVYRGYLKKWFSFLRNLYFTKIFYKIFNYLDSYLFCLSNNCFYFEKENVEIINIPGSHFLRPYSNILFLNNMQVVRIKKSMLHAARYNKIFHLWWHPHNFGINTKENIEILEQILKYYIFLKNKYDFQNFMMNDFNQRNEKK